MYFKAVPRIRCYQLLCIWKIGWEWCNFVWPHWIDYPEWGQAADFNNPNTLWSNSHHAHLQMLRQKEFNLNVWFYCFYSPYIYFFYLKGYFIIMLLWLKDAEQIYNVIKDITSCFTSGWMLWPTGGGGGTLLWKLLNIWKVSLHIPYTWSFLLKSVQCWAPFRSRCNFWIQWQIWQSEFHPVIVGIA